jgi:hypothetical protein
VASSVISAIKAPNSITKLDLRIRRMGGGSRLNGVPLTASTNRMSFTYRFYQIVKARNNSKSSLSEAKLLLFIIMLKNAAGWWVSHPVPYATLSHALYCETVDDDVV